VEDIHPANSFQEFCNMTDAFRQITLSAELESLAAFREHVKAACRGLAGLSDAALYDVQLAVDEICTNIITHGYAGMDPGSIILNVEATADEFTVSITDFGHAFEPVEPPAPDPNAPIEERGLGGLGLFIVHSSVDDIRYESSPAGNVTRLVKKLARSGDG
jgi:anti-sigma regulatory factor (Ser/Thr protein kinase)